MQKVFNIRGFTLIEVIFAVFIIGVSLLALAVSFSGTHSLVEDTKDTAIVDKQIGSKIEKVRITPYESIDELDGVSAPETEVTVTLKSSEQPDSTATIVVRLVNISSSTTRLAYPRNVTRSITCYVYEKGINYRP